jgi:hypothetical protein
VHQEVLALQQEGLVLVAERFQALLPAVRQQKPSAPRLRLDEPVLIEDYAGIRLSCQPLCSTCE